MVRQLSMTALRSRISKCRIAMWSLDTDYDERSLFPQQGFFPMAGKGEGWDKLKKDI